MLARLPTEAISAGAHTHTFFPRPSTHTGTRVHKHTLNLKRHVYSISNVLLCFISSVTFCKHQGNFQSIAYTTITLNTQENHQTPKHIICKQLMDPKNVFLSTRMRILSIKDKALGTICVQTALRTIYTEIRSARVLWIRPLESIDIIFNLCATLWEQLLSE